MASNHKAVVVRFKTWASARGWRMFENVVGSGWAGRMLNSYPASGVGKVVELGGATFQDFGLLIPALKGGEWTKSKNGPARKEKKYTGGSDLIGFAPTIITEDMVGRTLAIFAACEAKTIESPGLTEDQHHWLATVKGHGGIALVARPGVDGEIEVQEYTV